MVKNFAKAIFHYIRKNKLKRNSVLDLVGLTEQ
jgi:hypothetical protein